MSFILDALRKSETERQRQAAPSLADAQYSVGKKPRKNWVPVLIAVLAANLIIIAYVFFDDSREISATSQAVSAPTSRTGERHQSTPVGETALAAESMKPPTTVVMVAEPAPAPKPLAKPPPVTRITPATPPEPRPESINLPSMQQLIASGQLSLSPLHLDIHVYAGKSEKRFIFINMNKYREGDHLEEGPTVEEITDTGVILGHQGNRFTLDRQ
jgi:general secretion pathway protein B